MIGCTTKVRSTSTKRFKDFELRKSIIGNVLEALRDKKIDTIAFCGMGGIGKIEMAKEIARRVKAESLFNKVVTAVVSQSPSLTKIQDELAEMLGKRLEEKSLPGRANELYSRLTENKNVLVILDDVWEPLDIEAIGVYNAVKEKSCKILLTSRNEETCIGMKIQKIFPIGLLFEKEAWNFFIEMLEVFLATKVTKMSGKPRFSNLKCLAQKLSMVCIQRYGVAKRFRKGLGTVEETRVNVHAIVKNLRRSNLLLDSNEDECVKMNDIVRDVAISIASRDENGFMVALDRGLEEWPQKDRHDSYIAISLLLGEMKEHPIELKCTKLQLLRLLCLNKSETFPGNLFNEMKELKILSLQEGCFSLTSLPPSIQILQNLKMLNLESCHLGDVSTIGTLRNLEILGFCNSYIKELPSEIGNLSQLKLLDMKKCGSLERIATGVLSSLSRLEELYVGKFRNWACKTTMEGNGEVTNDNASIAELIPYSSQLVVLEISVPSILCLPKELHFCNSNFRFKIKIGTGLYDSTARRYFFDNTLELGVEDASDLREHQTVRSLVTGLYDSTTRRFFFENTLELGVEDASDLREHQTVCSLVKNAVVLHFNIARN
ncbi:hypothetical protein I3760_16G058000 [Carya illinoinensis]|nr:hypothetical protein I3760_16G058000 [Carya illinoinensis]